MAFDLITESKTHVAAFMIMSKEIHALMKVNPRHSTLKLADRITICNPRDVIYDAMVVYNYDNIRKFLERQLPFLITNIVLLSVDKSQKRDVKAALDFISNQVEKKPKKLIADHFPTIFPKIVTKASDTKEYHACINYIQDITKFHIKDLIRTNLSKVITELLLHYHSYPRR